MKEDVKYEKTKDAKVNNPNQLRGYEYIKEKGKVYKVKINFFKGMSQANIEDLQSGKLLMIRLKIKFLGNLNEYIGLDGIVAKDIVEEMDVDFGLIETFFKEHYVTEIVKEFLYPIKERYDGAMVGEYIGSVTLYYDEFTKLVNYLKYLAFDPLNE